MTTSDVGRWVELLAGTADMPSVRDGELLRHVPGDHKERAFAALMHRHGPMVFNVCRRVLRSVQDAEDAFQATFLVLARKARSIRKVDSLAPWLHGVALRLALKMKNSSMRRFGREQDAA